MDTRGRPGKRLSTGRRSLCRRDDRKNACKRGCSPRTAWNTHLQGCVPTGRPSKYVMLELLPCNSAKSRRPDSNRGPLHYELSASNAQIPRFPCKWGGQVEGPSPWKSAEVHSAPAMCSNGVPIGRPEGLVRAAPLPTAAGERAGAAAPGPRGRDAPRTGRQASRSCSAANTCWGSSGRRGARKSLPACGSRGRLARARATRTPPCCSPSQKLGVEAVSVERDGSGDSPRDQARSGESDLIGPPLRAR